MYKNKLRMKGRWSTCPTLRVGNVHVLKVFSTTLDAYTHRLRNACTVHVHVHVCSPACSKMRHSTFTVSAVYTVSLNKFLHPTTEHFFPSLVSCYLILHILHQLSVIQPSAQLLQREHTCIYFKTVQVLKPLNQFQIGFTTATSASNGIMAQHEGATSPVYILPHMRAQAQLFTTQSQFTAYHVLLFSKMAGALSSIAGVFQGMQVPQLSV